MNEHVLVAVEAAAAASGAGAGSCFAACPLANRTRGSGDGGGGAAAAAAAAAVVVAVRGAAGVPSYNRTTDCYINCFYEMLGASGNASVVSKVQLVAAWEGAFGAEEQGGCPQVAIGQHQHGVGTATDRVSLLQT